MLKNPNLLDEQKNLINIELAGYKQKLDETQIEYNAFMSEYNTNKKALEVAQSNLDSKKERIKQWKTTTNSNNCIQCI